MADGSKPISRRQRFEILRRDNHTCRYCGAQAPDVPLTVDHVVPRSLGGGDDPANLVTACRDCNNGKGSTSPDERIVEDVDAAALLFARAMERASELRHQAIRNAEQHHASFRHAWSDWGWTDSAGTRHVIPLPVDWESSFDRFVDLGLAPADIHRFIPVAMGKKGIVPSERFKYLCGCCWREITDRQEIARRLIEDGQV